MKKKISILTLIILLIILGTNVLATNSDELVYIIPVREEITSATERYIKLSIEEAENLNSDLIIFELDTYGGRIDSIEKIKNYITGTNIPTVCYIDSKAESAGVLFAISCDEIYMSPYGTIGSAETIPNTEKILSMWKSLLRNVAQNKGRDPDIIESMADADIEIEGIIEKGKLLNLTANEAEELEISDGTYNNIDELIEKIGYKDANIEIQKEDWTTKFAKKMSTQTASSLLLTVGFVGLVVEFFIPGFGLPGIVGGLSLLLFFGSNLLVGNASWLSLIFFIVGAVLLAIELFVPGFGLPGISGIVLVILGISTSMQTVQGAFTALLMAMVITVIIVYLIFRFGLNSRTFENITLEASIQGDSNRNIERDKTVVVGDKGIAATIMRPSGFIEINGETYDGIAESNYITKGAAVEVVKVTGGKIIVKEI